MNSMPGKKYLLQRSTRQNLVAKQRESVRLMARCIRWLRKPTSARVSSALARHVDAEPRLDSDS
jgi:hypothetical protein